MADIIVRQVTPDMVEKAKERSAKMGILNNSILSGKGNEVGFVGEFVIQRYAEEKYPDAKVEVCDTYDYDIMWDGVRMEVKTKKTKVEPRADYEASITGHNTRQGCDVYVFVRVLADFSKAYICGYETKAGYFNKARLIKKGDIDERNGWKCKSDCYNVDYGNLRQFKEGE